MDTGRRPVLHVVNAVTVNNGASRQVLVTPLSTTPPPSYFSSSSTRTLQRPISQASTSMAPTASSDDFVDKIMIRVESIKSSKVFRNFTLRGININIVNCCEELKKLIRDQLNDKIISRDFDIGYIQGTKVVRIRSRLDLQEFWQSYRKSSLILWCDGLKCEDTINDVERVQSSVSKKRKVQVC